MEDERLDDRIMRLYSIYGGQLLPFVESIPSMNSLYSEYGESIIYSENPYIDLAVLSIQLASSDEEVLKVIKSNFEDSELTDEDIKLLYATAISVLISRGIEQRNAAFVGYEWGNNDEIVDYYGSENQAEIAGYNDYISNISADLPILINSIAIQYEYLQDNNMKK